MNPSLQALLGRGRRLSVVGAPADSGHANKMLRSNRAGLIQLVPGTYQPAWHEPGRAWRAPAVARARSGWHKPGAWHVPHRPGTRRTRGRTSGRSPPPPRLSSSWRGSWRPWGRAARQTPWSGRPLFGPSRRPSGPSSWATSSRGSASRSPTTGSWPTGPSGARSGSSTPAALRGTFFYFTYLGRISIYLPISKLVALIACKIKVG